MKYVRTKDDIYEVAKIIQDCDVEDAYVVNLPKSEWDYDEDNKLFYEESKTDSFWKHEIIKESENLEDLVDGFWWENEMYDDPIFIPNYGLAIERINSWKESDKKFNTSSLSRIKIYASIYIRGSGWKHLAKLNNESEELELL